MEDDDIVKEMPNDWWMSHSSCLQLLAVLVHHSNPDMISSHATAMHEEGPRRQ